jgi:acetyl-CoA carboxylase biotin carboxylase subunit
MKMRRALQEYIIEGIKTNIAFQRRMMQFEPFVEGRYDTRVVERMLAGNK